MNKVTNMPEYHNYSFKVDGGLHVCTRADSEQKAFERIERAWPRSKIELLGVNLPSATRNNCGENVEPINSGFKMKTSVEPLRPVSHRATNAPESDLATAINDAVKEASNV